MQALRAERRAFDDGAPQFADVAVGFTASGASCALRAALDRGPNDVISTVVFALWRARATDVIRTSASRSGDEIGGVHDHAVGIGARRSDDRLSDGALGRCAADAKADRLERRGDLVEARRLEAHVVCGDCAGLDAEISAGARDRETPA